MSAIAAAIAGGAIVGGVISASGAKSAASTQANAANNAAQMQLDQYNQTRQDLSPYNSLGTASINPLLQAMGYTGNYDSNGNLTGLTQKSSILNSPFSFSAKDLDKTPGYQFTLQQGLKGVNNAAAAQGLGLSGAQLKGAASYTTGLADQTYGDQYNRALQTYQTNYNSAANNVNRLLGLTTLGQNSAAQTGSMGANATAGAANNLTSGANATAAGQVASANALGGAASNVGSAIALNRLNSLYGS